MLFSKGLNELLIMKMQDKAESALDLSVFIERVWEEGKAQYRDLPWRNIADPYAVLVSEIMLQQTQVVRVLKYWERFMSLFPTIDSLAAADTSVVLETWQGLGYNRRALALKKAAEICSRDHEGMLPESLEGLIALPGIGPATAGGVMAFAHNKPSLYLETNVRTVFIHELFQDSDCVSDKELIPLIEATCPHKNPRSWYYALLDYGAFLKQGFANPSRKSKHYAKQSKFEGSRRQKRAELLRFVLANPGIDEGRLENHLFAFEKEAGRTDMDRAVFLDIVDDMLKEGFFTQKENRFYA